MTQKELGYIEDAIGHETNIIKICTNTISMLDDDNLIDFIENQKSIHEELKNKLINMLEVKKDE